MGCFLGFNGCVVAALGEAARSGGKWRTWGKESSQISVVVEAEEFGHIALTTLDQTF